MCVIIRYCCISLSIFFFYKLFPHIFPYVLEIWEHYLFWLLCLNPETEFLDEIQTKVLKVFPLAIHSHLYNFALRFLFLQTHATSYIFLQTYTTSFCKYTVKEKGGKPERKPYPQPYVSRKSEISQDYVQKPQRNCTFMNSASRQEITDLWPQLSDNTQHSRLRVLRHCDQVCHRGRKSERES
jgi:hypothetical protein